MNILARIFGFRRKSKDVAKERLQLVLVHDRAKLAPELVEHLKEQIIEVISEYVDIDHRGLEVDLSREGSSVTLVANIPIVRIRRLSATSR